MSPLENSRLTAMDRAAKSCIKTSLKISNLVTAMTGIAILMYSVWMFAVWLREYIKYPLPWFFWACFGTGIIFSCVACMGYVVSNTKHNHLLSMYILFMFLLMVVESLITADIWLNDNWEEDFPKDYTKIFKNFVEFVENHPGKFKSLGLLVALSQVTSFILALLLRTLHLKSHRNIEDEEVILPFLSRQVQPPPYAIGHPDPQYYPPPPYTHGYGYPDLTGNEKGDYQAATLQAATKGC